MELLEDHGTIKEVSPTLRMLHRNRVDFSNIDCWRSKTSVGVKNIKWTQHFLVDIGQLDAHDSYWITVLGADIGCFQLELELLSDSCENDYYEHNSSRLHGMQYSESDIEMWDFEQLLDNSPLSVLTADFARFKQRFAKIFDGKSTGSAHLDSDSEESSGMSTCSAQIKARGNENKSSMDIKTQGSSQYQPLTQPQVDQLKQDSKFDSNKYYFTPQDNKESYGEKEQRNILNDKPNKRCLPTHPRVATPAAKRPTELAVIPQIITDEYISAMKTKAFISSDSITRPKNHSHPRLTQSYLDEHHNHAAMENNQNTTSLVHDWQFNKYQQELEDSLPSSSHYHDYLTNSSRTSYYSRANGSVRFRYPDSPIDIDSESSRSYIYRPGSTENQHSAAYIRPDNKLFKDDSWKGPSTPYPKAETSVGATHRGTHRFTPRHADEMEVQIGDSIHVLNEAEDGWCIGINLTTQCQGIFPAVYATDLEFYEIDEETIIKQPQPKQYKLHFLGSTEVSHHKGSDILVDAIEKTILNRRISKDTTTPPLCQLEVSEAGIKMIDLTHKKRSQKLMTDLNVESACERLSKLLAFSKETKAVSNHFFSLKNVSFCGYHPENPRYFGFITKHPTQQRFACHCYSSIDESTQPIVDSVGDAFQNYYSEYVPYSNSSEDDLYIE